MSEFSGCPRLAVCGVLLDGLDRFDRLDRFDGLDRPRRLHCVSAAARAARGYSFP